MDYQEAERKIVEELKRRTKGGKSKVYFNELAKILGLKPTDKDVKKLINQMIAKEILEYWSSGSTSMYGLKGEGKQQL
jgi:hypothetical protein